MVRRPFRYLLATTIALTGCSALLDVNDIYFDPNAVGPNAEGGSAEGSPTAEGSAGDGGADSVACAADTSKDPKHCGRCGHDCGGGSCMAGVCQGFELASVTSAPLNDVVAAGAYVFVSTSITLTTQNGGIWRVPKTGGMAEPYVATRYAEKMAVLADKLYFVVDETIANGGGLFTCPVVGASPCTPTLVAAAAEPRGLTVDNGRVFYGDNATGKGLMLYAPPAAPVVFRADFGALGDYYVSGDRAFYSITFQPSQPPQHAEVLEALTDGGINQIYTYDSPTANAGRLIGDQNQFLFTAFDFTGAPNGVVRRIPRTASAATCSLGGTANKRPYGIHTDGTHVYWTNQGEGASQPYTKGSVAACESAGCCANPTTLWNGDGEPSGLTGDADFLYFVTYVTGSVWKVAKP
jgi:hypothetical protein